MNYGFLPLRNILGLSVKPRTSSTPYRTNNVYSGSRKTMKQPKRSIFEIKIFDVPGSAIYKMDETDEKELQEIGTGLTVLHEGYSENGVMTEISNLIKSFYQEGTSIQESMIKFFKRYGKKRIFIIQDLFLMTILG